MKPHRHTPRIQLVARDLARAVASLACALLLFSLSMSQPLLAQTHKVAKSENVIRAVAVYEWTGDMAKPAASRLIPISLFIDGKFEDAAVYLARPVPFALLTGNVYELDKSGVPQGTLDLLFSRHLVPTDTAVADYDDGWFGYGKFVPPEPPRKSTLKPMKTLPVINGVDDESDDKPHFSSRSATPGSGGSATPTPGATPSDTNPADDPDRPTMKRHADTPDTSASSDSGATPADDPDRPTLRRRSPADAKKSNADQGSVTSVGSLNDDPNRPLLHRGKSEGMPTEADLPKLSGLPGDAELHQLVAVSDAADRQPHDFSLTWTDETEHQEILGKMQTLARAQLTAYEAANAAPPPAPPPDSRRPNSKLRRSIAKETPPPPEPLIEEQLKAYYLSYGGTPTYVYSAHTDGLGVALRFVTIVAQVDTQGEPQIVMKSVTDAAHLDRTPRMRLVDAVDAEASNRASLLFELRAQNSRQFALYRVIGARADQTFLTGTTE
jgi:hypothetical protein